MNIPKTVIFTGINDVIAESLDEVYFVPAGEKCLPSKAVMAVKANIEAFNFTAVGEFHTCYYFSKYAFLDEFVLFKKSELTVSVSSE